MKPDEAVDLLGWPNLKKVKNRRKALCRASERRRGLCSQPLKYAPGWDGEEVVMEGEVAGVDLQRWLRVEEEGCNQQQQQQQQRKKKQRKQRHCKMGTDCKAPRCVFFHPVEEKKETCIVEEKKEPLPAPLPGSSCSVQLEPGFRYACRFSDDPNDPVTFDKIGTLEGFDEAEERKEDEIDDWSGRLEALEEEEEEEENGQSETNSESEAEFAGAVQILDNPPPEGDAEVVSGAGYHDLLFRSIPCKGMLVLDLRRGLHGSSPAAAAEVVLGQAALGTLHVGYELPERVAVICSDKQRRAWRQYFTAVAVRSPLPADLVTAADTSLAVLLAIVSGHDPYTFPFPSPAVRGRVHQAVEELSEQGIVQGGAGYQVGVYGTGREVAMLSVPIWGWQAVRNCCEGQRLEAARIVCTAADASTTPESLLAAATRCGGGLQQPLAAALLSSNPQSLRETPGQNPRFSLSLPPYTVPVPAAIVRACPQARPQWARTICVFEGVGPAFLGLPGMQLFNRRLVLRSPGLTTPARAAEMLRAAAREELLAVSEIGFCAGAKPVWFAGCGTRTRAEVASVGAVPWFVPPVRPPAPPRSSRAALLKVRVSGLDEHGANTVADFASTIEGCSVHRRFRRGPGSCLLLLVAKEAYAALERGVRELNLPRWKGRDRRGVRLIGCRLDVLPSTTAAPSWRPDVPHAEVVLPEEAAGWLEALVPGVTAAPNPRHPEKIVLSSRCAELVEEAVQLAVSIRMKGRHGPERGFEAVLQGNTEQRLLSGEVCLHDRESCRIVGGQLAIASAPSVLARLASPPSVMVQGCCAACDDRSPDCSGVLQLCGHVSCGPCLINKGDSAVRCPVPSCGAPTTPSDLTGSLAAAVAPSAFWRADKESGFGPCPTPGCLSLLRLAGGFQTCPWCEQRVCPSCFVSDKLHAAFGSDCAAYHSVLASPATCPACGEQTCSTTPVCYHCGTAVCFYCNTDDPVHSTFFKNDCSGYLALRASGAACPKCQHLTHGSNVGWHHCLSCNTPVCTRCNVFDTDHAPFNCSEYEKFLRNRVWCPSCSKNVDSTLWADGILCHECEFCFSCYTNDPMHRQFGCKRFQEFRRYAERCRRCKCLHLPSRYFQLLPGYCESCSKIIRYAKRLGPSSGSG